MATTTRKTPTKTTQPVEPVEEYDFDGWTEEDEAKAIALIAPEIKYVIVERSFVGRFYDGTIVKATLSLSLADVDAMQAEYENEIDQFRALILAVGGEANRDALSRQDISDVAAMAGKYFDVLQRIQGATRPES